MSCTNGSKVVSKFGGLQTDILEKLWIVKCWIFGALNGHQSHQFLLCLGLNEGSWYPSPEQWKFGRWAVWGLENHWDHCGMFVISLSTKNPLEEIHYPPSLRMIQIQLRNLIPRPKSPFFKPPLMVTDMLTLKSVQWRNLQAEDDSRYPPARVAGTANVKEVSILSEKKVAINEGILEFGKIGHTCVDTLYILGHFPCIFFLDGRDWRVYGCPMLSSMDPRIIM